MAEVHGSCDDRFAGVREALAQHLDADELGASIAVDLDGETVVDLWGGFRDEARTTPWTAGHPGQRLVDDEDGAQPGRADAGRPRRARRRTRRWATTGRSSRPRARRTSLVRHLMSHTSGVSGWDQPFSIRDMYDWESSTERLALQRPWWEPGTASGYHANNQGHLVGEVIRRITGKTFKRFVAEEIAGPLGADFQVGAREGDWDRIAPVVPPPPPDVDFRTLDPAVGAGEDLHRARSPRPRRPTHRSGGGPTSARSTGTRTPAGCCRCCARCPSAGRPAACGCSRRRPSTWCSSSRPTASTSCSASASGGASATAWARPVIPYVPEGRTFFWGGWGGSMIVMDLDRRLTISYMMNRMAPGILGSDRAEAYIRAVYAAL